MYFILPHSNWCDFFDKFALIKKVFVVKSDINILIFVLMLRLLLFKMLNDCVNIYRVPHVLLPTNLSYKLNPHLFSFVIIWFKLR